jgi:hypothetical protein
MKLFLLSVFLLPFLGACKERSSQLKIYGGDRSNHLFIVEIQSKVGKKCSATIIGPNTLLTALHCLDNLGDGALRLVQDWSVHSVKAYLHPKVSQQTLDIFDSKEHFDQIRKNKALLEELISYDVAIVSFNKNFPNPTVAKMKKLKKSDLNNLNLFFGGYGFNHFAWDEKQQSFVYQNRHAEIGENATTSNTKPSRRRPAHISKPEKHSQRSQAAGPITISPRTIMAERKPDQEQALGLKGDSGTGLYSAENGKAFVFGVLSVITLSKGTHVQGNTYFAALNEELLGPIMTEIDKCDLAICPQIGDM